jgi:RNA polymerase sigma factor (sigma-70 family)
MTPEERDAAVTAILPAIEGLAFRLARRGFMSADDLRQAGTEGALRAWATFDRGKGKPEPYLVWAARQAMRRALQNSRTVRLPSSLHEARSRIAKAERSGPLDDQRLADRTGLSIARVRRAREVGPMLSLDVRLGDDDGRTHGDMVPSSVPTAEELLGEHQDRHNVRRLLGVLTPIEAVAIKARFGFGGRDPDTLGAIGLRFGVSHQCVSLWVASALDRLREAMSLSAAAE